MREAFVHEAILDMDPDADIRAPGAAVTLELCGQWNHEPPCPLAEHHTAAERTGRDVQVRILFATEPELAEEARLGIERALSAGSLAGADGSTTRWLVRQSIAGAVAPADVNRARRLSRGSA